MSFGVFQIRRGTAAEATSANVTLTLGEFAMETDTLRVKLGDGVTAWNSLAYYSTKILVGSGVPAGGLGSVGDVYIRSSNGELYLKTAVSTWTSQGNLTGPQGIQGIPGTPGAVGVVQTVAYPDATLVAAAGNTAADVKIKRAPVTGDVAIPDGSNTATIQANAVTTAKIADDQVTYTKMQNVAANNRILGRVSGAAGDTEELTGAQVTALLGDVSASLPGRMSVADYINLQNNRKMRVNILDFGADPTGATSSATALTNAQAALPSGGIIEFPAGTYQFGNTNYNLSTAHIKLLGVGYNTVFTTTSTTSPILTRNQYYQTIENITFTGPGTGQSPTATAGALLSCNAANSAYGKIVNVNTTYSFVGVDVSDTLTTVDGGEHRFFKSTGILCSQNSDHKIEDVTMDNNTSFLPTGGGVQITVTASMLMNSCNIIHANKALWLNAGAGVTIPSVKGVNNFFDNSAYGLCIDGGGSILRSEFTNSWFSSMSTAGIALTPSAGGQADGITFVNCDIYNNVAGTTNGILTNAQTKKWKAIGCSIAGWTTGINLVAGAAHYPTIIGNTIGSVSAFGVNTTGIAIGSGAYLGCLIAENDAANNTTPITIAATPTFADYKQFRIINNPGINVGGAQTPIAATPVLATVYTNTFGYPIMLLVRHGTTANTSVTINGAVNTMSIAASSIVSYRLEPGDTWSVAGGVAPNFWGWNKQ